MDCRKPGGRMKKPVIITFPGTAVESARSLIREAGGTLQVVDTLGAAKTAGFDRLLLLGGEDIWPGFYLLETRRVQDPSERDYIEYILLRRAREENKPIMGICRGHQLIAGCHQGTLYQDISHDTGVRHGRGGTHTLSYLARVLAQHIPTRKVNSYHHQAVDKLPFGFRVLARTEDGIIESIGAAGILGVQFHPEMLAMRDDRWLTLFRWFVAGLPELCQTAGEREVRYAVR
jgi:putative glutamine amidotransferase